MNDGYACRRSAQPSSDFGKEAHIYTAASKSTRPIYGCYDWFAQGTSDSENRFSSPCTTNAIIRWFRLVTASTDQCLTTSISANDDVLPAIQPTRNTLATQLQCTPPNSAYCLCSRARRLWNVTYNSSKGPLLFCCCEWE